MKLSTAIPILAGSAAIMLSSIGWAIAQERPPAPPAPQVRPEEDAPAPRSAGKLRPFLTGLEGRPDGRTSPGAPVEFTLEDADLPDIVRMISRVTGKRFILPAKARAIKATVVSSQPVTAAEAYRAFLSILDINGMTVEPSGAYFSIVESGEASHIAPLYTGGSATPNEDRYVTRMVRVRNVSAEDLSTLLSSFKSQDGSIIAYSPTNTLIITDTGSNIRRMMTILAEVDVPRTGEQIWIEPIHHATATELAERLTEIFPSGESRGGTGAGASPARGRARGADDGRPAGSSVASSSAPVHPSNIFADERTNSLIILATERAYLRILEVVRALDVPVEGEGSIHVHPLQYADAEDMASTLQSLIGSGSGAASKASRPSGVSAAAGGSGVLDGEIHVQAHAATNSLLITSSLHDYVALRRVMERLDVAPRQVFIEAVVMELSVQGSSSLGVAYHGGASPTVDGNSSLAIAGFDAGHTATASTSLSSDLLQGLAVGVRGPAISAASQLLGVSIPSFGVVLNAIANSADANVLSTPHIIAMDNIQAEINVGQNIPLQTSGLSGSLGNSLSSLASAASSSSSNLSSLAGLAGLSSMSGSSGVQRQNVGTTIRITPHINDAGEIRMEIEEEISEAGAPQGTLGVVPINQRLAKTQVVVRDQQTIVIGGLMRDRVSTTEEKVPVLGDIPILGALFRRRSTTNEKTNLMLFLTPYIIRSPADLRSIFERKLRERQEFIDRYFVLEDRAYTPLVDYSRTRGLVAEILNAVERADEEHQLAVEAGRLPEPVEHRPRAPIGGSDAPLDGALFITPDGEVDADPNAEPAPGGPAGD